MLYMTAKYAFWHSDIKQSFVPSHRLFVNIKNGTKFYIYIYEIKSFEICQVVSW